MISVGCDGISLSFGADTLFENVTFSLNDGDRLGIVGVNGAGKTTLLHIIAGLREADLGSVYISKDKSVGYLAQHNSYDSDKTIYDEMLTVYKPLIEAEKRLEELSRRAEKGDVSAAIEYAHENEKFIENKGLEFRSRCKGVLMNLGFGEEMFETKVKNLSGGQKERLSLAAILISDPDIIILDEPNNHLDIGNIEWLEKYLTQIHKTIIVVSHDRYFLCKVTNKTLEISNKKAKLYNGNYDFYIEQKKKDDEDREKQYKNNQKEIARLEGIIEQQRRWNREKNIVKAESTQKRLDKLEKVDAPDAKPESIRMRFKSAEVSGNDVLTIRSLAKGYGGRTLFENFDYDVYRGDRVMITGPNGCGKSTLLKILCGRINQDSGRYYYGYNVVCGYYDQENLNLNYSNTILDELWNTYPNLTETEIRSALALFLFKKEDVLKPISVLSGGERARVSIAKIIMSEINLLILDEPTNHLDILSMEVLEDALLQFDGTIIAVSHDRYFINKLSKRILSFNKDAIFTYEGNYKQYVEYRDRYLTENREKSDEGEKESKRKYLEAKQNTAEKRKIQRRIEALEKEAAESEAKLDSLNDEAQGDAASNHVRLSEIYELTAQLEERLLEIWAELEELKSE